MTTKLAGNTTGRRHPPPCNPFPAKPKIQPRPQDAQGEKVTIWPKERNKARTFLVHHVLVIITVVVVVVVVNEIEVLHLAGSRLYERRRGLVMRRIAKA